MSPCQGTCGPCLFSRFSSPSPGGLYLQRVTHLVLRLHTLGVIYASGKPQADRVGGAYRCQGALAASPPPSTARGHARRSTTMGQGDRMKSIPRECQGVSATCASLQIVCA